MIEVAALAISFGMFAIALYSSQKNASKQREKEIREDAEEESKIMLKLEFISNDMKEIKTDSKRTNEEVRRLSEDVAVMKKDVKALHYRVDKVEGKEVRK